MVSRAACWWDRLLGQRCLCASPVGLARITPHRATLLALIALYYTNDAIAAELGIARATVKREVEDLRDLTGCWSKGQLAHWWTEHRRLWDELHGTCNIIDITIGPSDP
jgi:DNA-binding CsgD family transcriptional regulator